MLAVKLFFSEKVTNNGNANTSPNIIQIFNINMIMNNFNLQFNTKNNSVLYMITQFMKQVLLF